MNTTATAGQVAATKTELCQLLRAFINQRPGLDYANYGSASSYRAEVRGITRQRADALQLLRAVELRESITADDIVQAFPRAFSGRLSLTRKAIHNKGAGLNCENGPAISSGPLCLSYCAGQYEPTEYRAAACAALASVLWAYMRANMPAPVGISDGSPIYQGSKPHLGNTAGQWLRRHFRHEFGRGIGSRWFN